MLVPFDGKNLVSCVSAIQSGLDQNSTLEALIIGKRGLVFQRNKHTSKLELVQSYAKQNDDANQPVALPQCVGVSSVPLPPQLGSSSIQIQSRIPSRDSGSPYMDGEVNLLQASPAKRPKVRNSSGENPCQTH